MINNKVFKNASWIVGCRIIQALLNLVISMMTARFLGPSTFGVINYAASIIAFVTPIMQLGINAVLVKEIVGSPDKEGEIIGSSILMCFLSAIVSIIGVVSFVSIANKGEKETVLVCAVYSLTLIFQAIEMIQYWFQAKYLSKCTSVIILVAYFFTSIYKIVLLLTNKSIYWFALSYSLDYFLIGIGLFYAYKKYGTKKITFSFNTIRRLFSQGKHFILSGLMVNIFAQTDKIMLKFFLDDASVGFYSAAVNCAGITGFVFIAIIDSMRPLIYENQSLSKEKYDDSVKLLYSIIIYLALAQSVVMSIFAKLIVHILYGEEYYAAVSALQIIVWYTTFSYIGAVRNIWIVAEKKQKYLWIINLFGAISNIILNLIFIPQFGINGAAVASLITQIFTNVIVGFILKPIKYNNILMLRSLNIKYLFNHVKKLIGYRKGK